MFETLDRDFFPMTVSPEAADPFTVPDTFFGVDFLDRHSADVESVLRDEITKGRARDVVISCEGSFPLFI